MVFISNNSPRCQLKQNIPVLLIFLNTIEISIKYSTIETKVAARIGYYEFPFPHDFTCEGQGV